MTDIRSLSDVEAAILAEAQADVLEAMWAIPEPDVAKCLVEHGMPRHAAQQQVVTKGFSFYARQFYLDVLDAKRGDPVAKEKVERCREAWGRMNSERGLVRTPKRRRKGR